MGPKPFPVVQEHLHERHERSSNDIPEFGFEIDSSTRCTDKVKQSWTLYAEGTSKPGEASLSALMIAVHGEAIRIDVFSPDMVQCLQRLFDRYHHSMVVHGYKEHAHLLGSIGVELPEPLFDTKLAGYLAHPDFHADTLEQAAAHFLDLHIEAQAESATQGTLDFDEPEENDSKNDELILTRTAIVGLLAEYLAGVLDKREQFGLLKSIELPVSQVLHGMEQVGAQVDMTRLVQMRDQLAADAAQAQETAWQFAGSR